MIFEKAKTAAKYISKANPTTPSKALILGSGSEKIIEHFKVLASLNFAEIPHFCPSTFHKGELLFAELQGTSIIILNGRLHYYEGFSMQDITFPIKVLKLLGIKEILMTNAAGGLNPSFLAGEMVLLKDHINLLGDNPLRGPNEERLGLRFPDMSQGYSNSLRSKIQTSANQILGKSLNEGVYAAFMGPSLETPAEYKMLHRLGADLVGMSTVPEVIVANHCQIEIAVISIVSNLCYPPEKIQPTDVETIIQQVEGTIPILSKIICQFYEAS